MRSWIWSIDWRKRRRWRMSIRWRKRKDEMQRKVEEMEVEEQEGGEKLKYTP